MKKRNKREEEVEYTGHQKRKRGQFESDCESMGDNFYAEDDLIRRFINRNKQVMSYIWTDERVKLLVTSFYDYAICPDTNITPLSDDTHKILLDELRNNLLTLAVDNEIPNSPTVNDITEKLNDLALCYKKRYTRYYDLKVILGKDTARDFRALVKHTRFNDYVKPGCTPQRVIYSDSLFELSRQSTSCRFYWTDKRLQDLVNSYYLLLDNLNSDSSGQSCLPTLKRKLCCDVTVPELRSRLNIIFIDYEEKSIAYEEFRIRIGKETCIFFDRLVNLEWNLYKNKDTTKSKSHGSSSKSRGSSYGRQSLARSKQADLERINRELVTSGLNEKRIAKLMIKFSDDNMRLSYWSCSSDLQKKYFLKQLLKL